MHVLSPCVHVVYLLLHLVQNKLYITSKSKDRNIAIAVEKDEQPAAACQHFTDEQQFTDEWT